MNQTEFDQVAATFAAFHSRFSPLFGRVEVRRRSEQYLRGLLVQRGERKNAENLSEAVDGATPRTLQRMLTESNWRVEPVIDRLQASLGERLSEAQGVFLLDESSFPKQGTKSVGVARQYCGRLGKVANCQTGVFLGYASSRGHALADFRLYLPEHWTRDSERRETAGVPEGIVFQTKLELAVDLLEAARARGHLTGSWVTADEGYGQVRAFRDQLDEAGWRYVLEVPADTPVLLQATVAEVPTRTGKRGPAPSKARPAKDGPSVRTVAEVATLLAPDAWETLCVGQGSQGPRCYEFASIRVFENNHGVSGREGWLVLRRNLDESELKFYLSNAPADTPLETMARVGAVRWSVETEFQTHKGQTGLDEYEVRSWKGWHHHVALSLLAGLFLLEVQQDWGKKDGGADPTTGGPGAGRTAATTTLEPEGLAGLAVGHATKEREGQSVAREAAAGPTPLWL